MAVDSTHPKYDEMVAAWQQMRDTVGGEKVVKSKGETYLPPTAGMREDGLGAQQPGGKAYKAYMTRAVFPHITSDAIDAALGIMHHKPPSIKLPARMQPLLNLATTKGENLRQLLRRINRAQLTTSRCGLLAEVPKVTRINDLPYLALYEAENIINWDDGARDELTEQTLNMLVLKETEAERIVIADGTKDSGDFFDWKDIEKYRVLILGSVEQNQPANSGEFYKVGVFRRDTSTQGRPGQGGQFNFSMDKLIVPTLGPRALQHIPFTIINATDLVIEPQNPSLLGLSNLCLQIYRLEADLRQALFMQGQDTLVVIGANSDEGDVRIGAGSRINLPEGGDAKFIGVSADGIPQMMETLDKDYNRAAAAAGQVLDTNSRTKESGDALKVRTGNATATLNSIAHAGAGGLESALKDIAMWMGENPDDVEVVPNTDFTDLKILGQDLAQFMAAKNLGAPMSNKSVHRFLSNHDMTEMTYEEELAEIDSEEPLGMMGAASEEGLAGNDNSSSEDA